MREVLAKVTNFIKWSTQYSMLTVTLTHPPVMSWAPCGKLPLWVKVSMQRSIMGYLRPWALHK